MSIVWCIINVVGDWKFRGVCTWSAVAPCLCCC